MSRPENDNAWRRNRPLPRASALRTGPRGLRRHQLAWVGGLALVSTAVLALANQTIGLSPKRTVALSGPPAMHEPPAPAVPKTAETTGQPPPAQDAGAPPPKREVAAVPASTEIKLSPPYEVADGLTITTETRKVHLSGLEGPASEAACYDEQKRLWACGLEARAALNNLIRKRDVTCRTTGRTASGLPDAECRAGDLSLARVLVAAGFARPLGQPGTDIEAELKDAKGNQRGLWNGGWQIRGR